MPKTAPQKRTICLIIPTLEAGGAQKSLLRLGKLLSPAFNIRVFAFDPTHSEILPDEFEVEYLDANPSGARLVRWMRLARRYRSILAEARPVVSISFLEGANYINAFASLGLSRSLVSVRGSYRADTGLAGLYGFIRRKILIPTSVRLANLTVCVSNDLRSEMIEYFHAKPQNTITIHNVFDFSEEPRVTSRMKRDPATYRAVSDRHVSCVSVGRLHPQKNHEFLISLCAYMRDKSSLRMKLKIVGNGPLMAHLKDMAVEKGLRVSPEPHGCADVSFTGSVANVFDHLSTADLFLFPSRYEGMPNALMEAMYAGVPTIAADCPTGPRELLGSPEPGGKPAGILVPVPDASSTADLERWTQAICWLHSNETSRSELVSLARQRLQEFAPEKISAKWLRAIAGEQGANSLIDERFGTDSACVE